jgi:dipeptidyl aminopeptidase/acylaminoacyl peptidase
VRTEIVLYPREGHGLGERAHQLDFAQRFVDWFDEHV